MTLKKKIDILKFKNPPKKVNLQVIHKQYFLQKCSTTIFFYFDDYLLSKKSN